MQLQPSGLWVEYTSLKKLIDYEYAASLAAHLQRNQTSWRIVEVGTNKGERIVQEWQSPKTRSGENQKSTSSEKL
jgi:hypothetical protein